MPRQLLAIAKMHIENNQIFFNIGNNSIKIKIISSGHLKGTLGHLTENPFTIAMNNIEFHYSQPSASLGALN